MRKLLTLGLASLALAGCGGADGVDDHDRWLLDHPGPCDEPIAEVEAEIVAMRTTMKVHLREADAEKVDDVATDLREIDGVRSARAISKEQALEEAKQLFEDSPGVMDNLPGNPFPASVELRVDRARAGSIAKQARKLPEVDEVADRGDRAARVWQRVVDLYHGEGDQQRVCDALDATDDMSLYELGVLE